jgi:Putative Actinobacterial Holin-X, holin superfamily III
VPAQIVTPQETRQVPPVSREETVEDVSRLAGARRAILGLTEILEDSVDLLGATIREEVARAPSLWVAPAVGLFSALAGAGFLTAAAAFFLRDLFGEWSLSFLALGAFYVVVGIVVWKSARRRASA